MAVKAMKATASVITVTLVKESRVSQVALMVNHPPANERDIRDSGPVPGLGRSPREGNGNSLTPVFLPGKSHGQRSLVGSCLSGLKESDTA